MTDDTRTTCMTCANRRRGQGGLMACMDPHRAGIRCEPGATFLTIGRDFATLPQHCPAHVPRKEAKA